jgi:xanthine dehydrogenase FAD-binding subunit
VEALSFRPSTLREALELRAAHGAVPFAGGTDLMVRLRGGAGVVPRFDRPVLFLDRCAGLGGIRAVDGGVEIGAAATLREIAESDLVHPALRQAVSQMGGPALRNVATIGGNVCNASPAADTLPFLSAFDARVRLASAAAERVLGIADLVTGPGRTCLRGDELLASILVPDWRPACSLWRKVGTRKANALTKVSIAGFVDIGGAGADHESGRRAHGAVIARARVALGAVGPTVVRVRTVEALLEGAPLAEVGGLEARARSLTLEAVHPIDDQRSTADYRREVAARLVAELLRLLSLRE